VAPHVPAICSLLSLHMLHGERVKPKGAPRPEVSPGPPITAVFPSAESDTEEPKFAAPLLPPGPSFWPCWVQVPLLRVNTQAPPRPPPSRGRPVRQVFQGPGNAAA